MASELEITSRAREGRATRVHILPLPPPCTAAKADRVNAMAAQHHSPTDRGLALLAPGR